MSVAQTHPRVAQTRLRVAQTQLRLARDPALPQRDLLLDEREVARRLSRVLGVGGRLDIDACVRVRTKYRVGGSLRVLHRVSAGGRSFTVAARTFPGGGSLRAYERATCSETTARAASACGPLRAVARDAEIETVFWTFPNDRRLSNLRVFTDVPPELSRVLSGEWATSRVVAYAPEKCATAECLDASGRVLAYAKVYAGDEGRRVYAVYRALERETGDRDDESFAVARPLAYDDAHRALLVAPAPGTRIADLDPSDWPSGYGRLGAALAALHGAPAPSGLSPFRRLEVARLRRAARAVGAARPDVLREADELADRLEATRGLIDAGPDVCLHGDVHAKNGLLLGRRLTLIDLDQCGAGSAAADVGSLLAGLIYGRVTSGGRFPERTLSESFLAGYASARRLPTRESLAWHTAAALLAERALRAVNRVRPAGLARLPELLATAAEILRKGVTR